MFTIEIDTGNDAFSDSAGAEVARILREVAARAEAGAEFGKLYDVNGNHVGEWHLETEDSDDD